MQIREQELLADSVLPPARHPDVRYTTLLCSSVSPWSKTGAFYYPRCLFVNACNGDCSLVMSFIMKTVQVS